MKSLRKHHSVLKANAFPKVALFLALFLFVSQALHATLLYDQQFTNTGGGNHTLSTVSWSEYISASATTSVSDTAHVFITNLAGNPASPTGFLSVNMASTHPVGPDAILTTGLSLSNVSTISWVMGSANTGSTTASVKILVQVGGNWYASATNFIPTTILNSSAFTSATPSTIANTFSYSLTAANWLDFTLNPDTSMSVGSTTGSDLPSSPITGIGFYITETVPTSSMTVRLDDLQVFDVPEPASCALLVMGVAVLGMGARLRRRR